MDLTSLSWQRTLARLNDARATHPLMGEADLLSSDRTSRLGSGIRLAAYLDMLLIDHGIFRLGYLNQHRLGDCAWRSAQPAPFQIHAFARRGLRTIINLRGERRCGSYRLEREACERSGIALVDFHIRSRRAPSPQEIKAALELFERIEYPMLVHCKSGADRTGFMSVLYCHLREGVPLPEARKQLSYLYGYFRWTRAGILDAFFERYLRDRGYGTISLMQWVETIYDPQELMNAFRAKGQCR